MKMLLKGTPKRIGKAKQKPGQIKQRCDFVQTQPDPERKLCSISYTRPPSEGAESRHAEGGE